MFEHVWTCLNMLKSFLLAETVVCVAEDTTTSYPRLLCSPWLDMKCAVSSQLTWALNKHRHWSHTWRAGACPSAASSLNIGMRLVCFSCCFNIHWFKMKWPNFGVWFEAQLFVGLDVWCLGMCWTTLLSCWLDHRTCSAQRRWTDCSWPSCLHNAATRMQ